MKILMAKSYGFCLGVKRAVDIAMSEANKTKEKISILGDLVHNQQVIDKLNSMDISEITSPDEADGTVVITAHGVSDSIIKELELRGINVIDTTCFFVKKVHEISKKYDKSGFNVIVIGDSRHTEVKGIVGNLRKYFVIQELEDVKKLTALSKIAIVRQTTQQEANFDAIAEELRKRADNVVVKKTICPATSERQKAAMDLAKEAELVVVVGGRKSANTKRLYEICNYITESKRIESAEDVEKVWFKGIDTVGVTAGASTPEWVIKEVVEKIRYYGT